MPFDILFIDISIIPFFENDIDFSEAISDYQSKKYNYIILKDLLTLVKQYNATLPIVNSASGVIYSENKEYDEVVKTYVPKK